MKKYLKAALAAIIAVMVFTACSGKKENTVAGAAAVTPEIIDDSGDITIQEDVLFELTDPRTNSQEILNFQKRLLELGFTAIGTADGYYGPMAEGVVKNIQAFAGFERVPENPHFYWDRHLLVPTGKVNQALWDYVFDNNNSSVLRNISIVGAYDTNNLTKVVVYINRGEIKTEYGMDVYYETAAVYHSSTDRNVKVLEYRYSQGPGNGAPGGGTTSITCHFASGSYYFIDYKIQDDVEGITLSEERYLADNNALFKIRNGRLERTGSDITERVNDILNKFPAVTQTYGKILNGDLSGFSGAWENSRGDKVRLLSNGTFFDEEGTAKDFSFNRETGTYGWDVGTEYDGRWEGRGIYLLPAGVSAWAFDYDKLDWVITSTTDTTKVRLLIYWKQQPPDRSSLPNEIYYRE